MLDDVARKVLTILWNTYRNDPFTIDVAHISHRAQRTDGRVKIAINTLVKEGFVLWDRQSKNFRVLYNHEDAKPKRWN